MIRRGVAVKRSAIRDWADTETGSIITPRVRATLRNRFCRGRPDDAAPGSDLHQLTSQQIRQFGRGKLRLSFPINHELLAGLCADRDTFPLRQNLAELFVLI